ncbi:MAG: PD-(D/E)XK nuclease family protein [Desulfobacterales bacterium]
MNPKIAEISLHECFDRLAGREAVLTTATRRLSRSMAARYAEYRMEKGNEAWPTPDILPFGAWLSRFFRDYLRSCPAVEESGEVFLHLMDDFRENLVWERIISESDNGAELLGLSETARMAREAWGLCREWKVETGQGIEWSAPDSAAFAGWAASFEKFCRDNRYMDTAGLPVFLAEKVRRGLVPPPGDLILAGFDEYSPALLELISAIRESGTRVSAAARPQKNVSACRVCLEDDSSEIRAAALWARQRIEENPRARIGVVSPRLAEDRETVRRVFADVFHPSAVFSGSEPENSMFQISAAPPLLQYPVISAAKAVLELVGRRGAEVLEWSRILRLPFTGGAESEYTSRAALDAEIRDKGDLYFTVSGVAAAAASRIRSLRGGSDLRILAGILEKLRVRAQNMPREQEPDKWMEEFSKILEDAGWPGERSQASAEYQTVLAWHDVLESFSGLGSLTGPVSFTMALGLLSRRLSDTPFQPEQPDAGVRISGVLESAGEEFDALWIMGLHHEQWPPPARPNAFVPVDIQRSSGLPRCSPARELSYSAKITERLIESAKETVCSYGKTDGESIRLPSPLIDHLKQHHPDDVLPSGQDEYWRQISCCADVQEIVDTKGAPVTQGADMGGGTGLFKSQALCPFQAYARYRLGACAPETPEPGLKPWQRGTLVHRALEFFWRGLGKSSALEKLSPYQIEDRIREAVEAAVSKIAGEMPQTFTDRFTRLETLRLKNLIREWITAETGRAPFSVKATESRINLDIGGIRISASADRIDRLDDGRLVIIDYKTGDISAGDWFAERLTEPQLPLYSLAVGKDRLAGVFLGRVKKNEAGYIGIASSDGIVPGCRGVMDDRKIAGDFQSLGGIIDYWEIKLYDLAEEIKAGYAAVLPFSENKACRYCDLSQVCRIWEAKAQAGAGREADNEADH